MPSRPAFSLIELLVALLVLTVGLLGLVGTAAAVSRLMGGARRLTVAAHVAERRLELLRSGGCGALRGGSATTLGLSESWTVTAVSARTFEVVESVTTTEMSRHTPTTRSYRTMVGC